jgi:hypothetical protein
MGSGWQQLTALGISTYLTWRFRGMLHDSVILPSFCLWFNYHTYAFCTIPELFLLSAGNTGSYPEWMRVRLHLVAFVPRTMPLS